MIDEGDPERESSPSPLTRLSHRVFGDPRKAPKRLATLLVFALFGFIGVGVWLFMNARIDTSGSSAPIVGPLLTILTHPFIAVVIAAWLTRRWLFFRRGRNAGLAADVSGWAVETVEQLRDEIKTTDGCTRIIASTGDSREEIAAKIDAALEGEYDDDTVEFWDADDGDDTEGVHWPDLEITRLDALYAREDELVAEYIQRADRVEELLDNALEADLTFNDLLGDSRASLYELMDGDSQASVDEASRLLEHCDQIEAELETVRDEIDDLEYQDPFAAVADGIEDGAALEAELAEAGYDRDEFEPTHWERVKDFVSARTPSLESIIDRLSRPDSEVEPDETGEIGEPTVPWRVRFFEEVKHLWLDLQSGFRTGDAAVKFGVPFGVTFGLQLFAVGLWTTVPMYLLMLASSTAVGLGWFWIVKRRRQRRLRRYRAESGEEYWLDCAGQFKTVETADVTAYMGFIAGRRYASYDREEFVRKTARTMHQHVSDECVAPSDLQRYARCLAQMKPNLEGHRENVIRPLILRDLKQRVQAAEDDLIPKAELAWLVIEQPTSSKIERRLGHDPELVREEYQWLVEDAHVLDERDVEFRDASGETQTLTLVFPAEKNRLPDVSERHSQFSDRFTHKKGEPVYELPTVDPRDSLRGFIPTPEAAQLFDGEQPAVATARGD
ncbi:hypothetical protein CHINAEXTREME_20475 (plasmid) [Halobiforma lacisalsi AJ5]|uniref:Uncharacterized protein n=1 Tax=Natronobacterium lacisalsi AJ5 TaxID=358396 RepID=M0LW61_NATLA|nr:hypothetical protein CHINAEXTREME_20475 [Halobiforma lacisalsi AJ5]EMA37393.1 hypothetical protein C445_00851 [Halobiforma lacisalsi AJ5]